MGAAVNGMALHGGIVQALRLDLPRSSPTTCGRRSGSRRSWAAGRLGLLARLDRGRRGRPDPPADRALRGAAGDPGPDRDPARRRRRDRRGVAGGARGVRRAGVHAAHPPGPARARSQRSSAAASGLARGGYVLSDPARAIRRGRSLATGSEVAVALEAQDELSSEGIGARVVSMPSWELFEAQPDEYRESVFPAGVPVVAVEAGVALGWERYADRTVSVDRFGARRPGRRSSNASASPRGRYDGGPRARRPPPS